MNFSPNTGKCGLEKTPYLDAFYAVLVSSEALMIVNKVIW